MSELVHVLETLVAEADSGRPSVFCVVLEKYGSGPRLPGAAMLIRADGSSVGTIGGGAVEAVGLREGRTLLGEHDPKLLELALDADLDAPDAPICGGRVVVGFVPLWSEARLEPFREALRAAKAYRPAEIPIVVEHGGRRRAYRLGVEVPPTLIIAGGGHIGQAVARFAVDLDFRVVVLDDRADVALPERFDHRVELIIGDAATTLRTMPVDTNSYVAIMTRGHRHDRAALDAVIHRPVAYIGLIASRRKARKVLAAMAASGAPPELVERVHTPIGLPIGAVTVNEIALSIVAELVKVRRQSTPKLVEGPLPVAPE